MILPGQPASPLLVYSVNDPGCWAPLDASTIRAASASHLMSAISRSKTIEPAVLRRLSAHVASLCCISLIIKGLHLVRSDHVHSKLLKLLPFAM